MYDNLLWFRLMCTKLFSVPVSRKTSRMERKADSCSGDVNRSRPLNMTLLREEGLALSFSLDRGDSGELALFENVELKNP